MTVLLLTLFGGLGAACRFMVGGHVHDRWSPVFPWATMLVNVSGSFAVGLLSGALLFHSLPTGVHTVLAVGFCGGYTTFSTAMVETVRLVQEAEYRRAVSNALASLLLTLAAAAAGVGLMRLAA